MKRIIPALAFVLLIMGLVSLSSPARVQANPGTTIDTTPAWDGSSSVCSFGNPNTATYGQTITVPATDNVLLRFSFFMAVDPLTVFRGYVFAWDGSKAAVPILVKGPSTTSTTLASAPQGPSATGLPLFESGNRSTTNGSVFQEIVFDISHGGVPLQSGSQYVLFASISKTPGTGSGCWGQPQNQNTYPGGGFVFINNGTDPSQWISSSWTQNWLGTAGDLAFRATFASPSELVPAPAPREVPEANTLFLLAGGLGGMTTWLSWQWRKTPKKK